MDDMRPVSRLVFFSSFRTYSADFSLWFTWLALILASGMVHLLLCTSDTAVWQYGITTASTSLYGFHELWHHWSSTRLQRARISLPFSGVLLT